MKEALKMDYYNPEEANNYNQTHTILYTFQYCDAFAHFITTMSGNVMGGSVMNTELDCGVTAPIDEEINKKYVLFNTEDENELLYKEVGELRFFYPDESHVDIPLDECSDLLVGIQIIKYEP